MIAANDNLSLPRSRSLAVADGSHIYFTGKPCKFGHISTRNTRYGFCHECNRLKTRAWALANPDRKREADKRYVLENAERVRANKKEWAKANVDAVRARTREWEKSNPDRASTNYRNRRSRKRNAEGFHTENDIAEILAKQKFKCVYCESDVTNKESRHVDHIMPLILGGSNWPMNIQILCGPCNLSKNATHPDEYEKRIGFIRPANDNEDQAEAA